ncbi:MAG: asparaginyl/glutamyl-tRNA amidotransferase subunit C [Candidatus Buchananbacteria bacterium RIFCSPHIGHO2_01_FULL_39_8]|uniref:Aspartyl/glutamyl-tRNA(Asn/Gln) amidotransferase subunit C n=1 Tax=Candidatus Buchananbacteria bacterium RIFCSPHIGHO2_01_FULL_39_8 TaxID=1797533 RepID=A0A1G1Y1M5_9BACT|nr:MAG: asparaginyl/glutamyl-tRNA amidotransferase subunit C [Candidatus Buchananbacteria bacterium RIFCSPHIGHO2_01_FULL_39_8]
MKLTKKEVEHIAYLARLGLTEEEKGKFAEQLSSILDYVEQLKEVDTKGVEPTAQVTGLESVLRPDEIVEVSREVKENLLNNAPEKEDNLVKTRSVFE